MGRVAALDYGKVRCGLAISDERRVLASPLTVVPASPSAVEAALKPFSPDLLIIGLPLLLNGKEGPMATEVRKWAEALTIPILFWDERLTTAQADRMLRDSDLSRKKRTQHHDTMAATIILQSYLDSL